ncbi:MAG: macrolide ABC transporter ATP-binding protein [Nitrospira bacterium SM23_35]|jgi:putative ABC transport system ATP-binding protein|nr:MAG: macrolide ABC transporter ATP-binding protein [Nitrospira bacterium SM23_35]
MPLCLLDDIRKTYKMGDVAIEVLRGIHLQVEQGEFVAIMGTSGSGKTTLMNIIGCLDVATSGRYMLADREISRLSDDELSVIRNEHIGFVFQNFYLLPYATVLENVLLPSLYIDKRRDNFEQKAAGLLQTVGLKERIKFKPPQLSGGEQQRVAIARALMNDPDLLLTDEPTGQLDSKTAVEIMDLLAQMNRDGKTVIVITHDPNIAAYAGRTVRIQDGVIMQ